MNKLFNPSSDEVRILAVLYCVFGVVLLVFNVDILLIIIQILGFVTFALGLAIMYVYLSKIRNLTKSSVFIGFPASVFGLLMLMSPECLLSIFPTITAILLIVHALFHFERTFRLKKAGFTNWSALLIVGIIILILGALIITGLIKNDSVILKLIGTGLITLAITLFVVDGLSKKLLPQQEKIS